MSLKSKFNTFFNFFVGVLRVAVPPMLIVSMTNFCFQLATGVVLSVWFTNIFTLWFVLGYFTLSNELPSSLPQAIRILVRASVWPWYLWKKSNAFFDNMTKVKITLSLLLTILAAFFIINAPADDSIPPNVLEFISTMKFLGIVFFMIYFSSASVKTFTNGYNPLFTIESSIYFIISLTVGFAFIKYVSSDVKSLLQYVNAHTAETLTAFIAIAFVKFLFDRSLGLQATIGISGPAIAGCAPTMASSILKVPTDRDNRVAAAHEAGHTLLYASLGNNIPEDIYVSIGCQPGQSNSLGRVSEIEWENLLQPHTFAEWHMLVYLGGQEGERALLGDTSLGATSDMLNWQATAIKYLNNGFGDIYFTEPNNQAEAALNQATLESLRSRQRDLLKCFFERNKQVLEDLSVALLEKKKLSKEDLIPFLSRVQFDVEFPRLVMDKES